MDDKIYIVFNLWKEIIDLDTCLNICFRVIIKFMCEINLN